MIEIVTHCWSGPQVPIYHRLLQLQLSSFFHFEGSVPARLVVHFSTNDTETAKVLSYFFEKYAGCQHRSLALHALPESKLFRRAIGRNISAKTTKADAVWFTDVDYLFYDGCLDAAYAGWEQNKGGLIYPSQSKILANHREGDILVHTLEMMGHVREFILPEDYRRDKFRTKTHTRSIGGVQIVDGDWCREKGYCDGIRRAQRKANPEDGFLKCRGDVTFRRQFDSSEKVTIPNLYRIRHSHCGRDGGTVDHSRK